MDVDVPGFDCHAYLRDSCPTGGLLLWTRVNTGRAVCPWVSSSDSPMWMPSERAWVLLEGASARIACCGVYLRTESPKSSTFFMNNESFLHLIGAETIELEEDGTTFGKGAEVNMTRGRQQVRLRNRLCETHLQETKPVPCPSSVRTGAGRKRGGHPKYPGKLANV